MKRLLKWTGYAIGTVAVLALGAVALVYVQSERLRSQTFEVPAGALAGAIAPKIKERGMSPVTR